MRTIALKTKINRKAKAAACIAFAAAAGVLPASARAQTQNGGGAPTQSMSPAQVQSQPAPASANGVVLPLQINGQLNYIGQSVFRFHSPYTGTNSFLSRNETEVSETYTLYMGARLRPNFEVYVDPEEASGKGLSSALGLAGFVNNDVIRNPTLSQEPYLARYFIRYTVALGAGDQMVAGSPNQIAEPVRNDRLVLTAGKVSAPDFFDINTYAGSSHSSFVNWVLVNTGAWDYAADTRGYTRGVVAEYIHPAYAVRLGIFQMPSVANGINLANRLNTNRGDNLEVELHPLVLKKTGTPMIVRLLGYHNVAHMGDYAEAIVQAAETDTTPVIQNTEHVGNPKYGGGLNFEQALGDDGGTGVFGRFSADDGKTESFAYTEVDRALSGGAQISAAHLFHRPQDHFAIAFAQNQLSSEHRDYLADGGLGFLLGDGKLNYDPEEIVETYYDYRVAGGVTISPDFQHIANPGYNRDRGPINVASLRFHAEF